MRWFWRSVKLFCSLLLLYQVWLFAHVCWWVKFNPSSSAFMDTRLEIMQDKNPDAELRQKWVPYSRISDNLKRALIASEDARFVDHSNTLLWSTNRASSDAISARFRLSEFLRLATTSAGVRHRDSLSCMISSRVSMNALLDGLNFTHQQTCANSQT